MEFEKELVILYENKVNNLSCLTGYVVNQIDLDGPLNRGLIQVDEIEGHEDEDKIDTVDLIRQLNYLFSEYGLTSNRYKYALQIYDYDLKSIEISLLLITNPVMFDINYVPYLCELYEDIRRIDNYKEDLDDVCGRGLWPDNGMGDKGTAALKLVEQNMESSLNALNEAIADLYDYFLHLTKVNISKTERTFE